MESERIPPSTCKTGFEVIREHTENMLIEVGDDEEVSSDISFVCDDGSTNNECTTHPGSDIMFVHWLHLKLLFKLCSQCTDEITKITCTGALFSLRTECN